MDLEKFKIVKSDKNFENDFYKLIVLEVKKNEKAIIVYEKFRFKKEKELTLKINRKSFSFFRMI